VKHVDRICKQEVVERRLDLSVCCADERTANYCGVSATTVKNIRSENKRRNLGSRLNSAGKKMTGKSERAAGDFVLRVVKRTHI